MSTLDTETARMNAAQLDYEVTRAEEFCASVAGRIYLEAMAAEIARMQSQFPSLRVMSKPGDAEQFAQNCGAISALGQFSDPAARVRPVIEAIKAANRERRGGA